MFALCELASPQPRRPLMWALPSAALLSDRILGTVFHDIHSYDMVINGHMTLWQCLLPQILIFNDSALVLDLLAKVQV